MENETNQTPAIRVGVVDDQIAVTTAFARLLNSMQGITCVIEAYNGIELLDHLKATADLPHILLMDVDMPRMNGIEATRKVSKLYPNIKVIAFTGKEDEWTMRQMISAGACAHLLKYVRIDDLEDAIRKVHINGKYWADLHYLYGKGFRMYENEIGNITLTENEIKFLRLLCKGYSYRQMCEEMQVSIQSIYYYKDCLSEKLNTKDVVTMSWEALRMGIVRLYE